MKSGVAVGAVVLAPVAGLLAFLLVVGVLLEPAATVEQGEFSPAEGGVIFDATASTFVDQGGSSNAWGVGGVTFENGRIPLEHLCPLAWDAGELLRCDAAEQLSHLNDAFTQAFGHPLVVTDSYRDYAAQVKAKKEKGFLAATPGYSNHGWAIAVDLGSGVQNENSPAYAWMKANGSKYGWFHPTWAEPASPDFEKKEPWHWQFVAAALEQDAPTTLTGNRGVGQELAAARGWTGAQWECLDQLWQRESGWNHLAKNPASSAYGIPQALPGSKMAAAGSDWVSDPATQIRWGLEYIAGRYGTPCGAWAHSEDVGWY